MLDLIVGKVSELPDVFSPNLVIVNLSSVYHKQYHHWEKASPSDHRCYVLHREEDLFSLNWVDGPAQYFNYQDKGPENVRFAIGFIAQALAKGKKVFICCDQGQSRSPSIALLYLAFDNIINRESYQKAKEDFMKFYPEYRPGEGIQQFLSKHWSEIILPYE